MLCLNHRTHKSIAAINPIPANTPNPCSLCFYHSSPFPIRNQFQTTSRCSRCHLEEPSPDQRRCRRAQIPQGPTHFSHSASPPQTPTPSSQTADIDPRSPATSSPCSLCHSPCLPSPKP
ncbi:hypothetical protein M0R45_031106 [Rubus argutus]|uniref:Uncharacterized protein n=1 Tax=Rubus argutus TaxID=59490 RepID=A0AAW1WDA8_RUBAR